MPRGFLVKRHRKGCGSYRIPCDQTGPVHPVSYSSVIDVLTPYTSTLAVTGTIERDKTQQEPNMSDGASQSTSNISPIKVPPRMEQTGPPWKPLPYSPVKPVDLEMKKTFFKRYVNSPASADSFPAPDTFASMEKLFVHPFLTPDTKLQTNLSPKESPRSNKLQSKKIKVSRKLHFADEVTTSPVLGLKIKAEEPDGRSRGNQVKRPPLGEFICQLCKERYPDPFALAQHKCSRIVRVEYRCPECDKIFSCPANLASHRRWHKPRSMAPDGPAGKKLQAPIEGKENSSLVEPQAQRSGIQHQQAMDSSQPHQADHQHLSTENSSYQTREDNQTPMTHSTPEDAEEEVFDCPYCHKRFRRHAYLRKHLLSHQPFNPLERGQHTYPCTLCGVHFPSIDIRDKHRLWHAVREELLIPLEEAMLAEGGQQIFPCELCPTAFFSAPGLTLHMSKCHSPQSRQDIPQIPIVPGC
ncbi:insulinoma-associated protein 2 [Pelobates fuscus]|uniref:insulinoma-associated protein 2 n=1 Tax=Pelobates fuscus TaxID=191477 RepID=UPI002FE44765